MASGWRCSVSRLHASYDAVLGQAVPGPTRAEAAHLLIGRAVAEVKGVTPTCKLGCSACCHFEVEVTRDEAELLAAVVVSGVAIDRERLARQAARQRGDPAWAALVAPENRCVFLGDEGECRVYAHRPSACRRLLVASPAVECGRPGGAPVPITIPVAELVVSAALSLPGNHFTSLAKGVAAELTWAGRTSMEAELTVTAVNLLTGKTTHTNTAYFVYVAIDREGHALGRYFSARGLTVAVLKYRLPEAAAPATGLPPSQQDALAAVRLVRSRARDWGVDPRREGLAIGD